jgi:hypothetical protein
MTQSEEAGCNTTQGSTATHHPLESLLPHGISIGDLRVCAHAQPHTCPHCATNHKSSSRARQYTVAVVQAIVTTVPQQHVKPLQSNQC